MVAVCLQLFVSKNSIFPGEQNNTSSGLHHWCIAAIKQLDNCALSFMATSLDVPELIYFLLIFVLFNRLKINEAFCVAQVAHCYACKVARAFKQSQAVSLVYVGQKYRR